MEFVVIGFGYGWRLFDVFEVQFDFSDQPLFLAGFELLDRYFGLGLMGAD